MTRTSVGFVAVAAMVFGCMSPPGQGSGDDDPIVDAGPGDDDARGGGPDAGEDAAPDAGPVDYPYSDLDEGCAPIFRQSIVPEYHLTFTPEEWAALEEEFLNPQFSPNGSIIEPPYHHVQLRIVEGDVVHEPADVMIRINGNTSWLQTIMFDEHPKMQFMIAFNKVDDDGRFQGQRKIKLDMPRSDWTFLQQRVGLAWLRGRAGVPAQCANSARVYIDGEFYGLFTNVERQDKGFLERVFGDAYDNGDLWKGGRDIKTNEETFTWERISAFWDITDLAGLDALTDLDTSMVEWASEAVIGDCDGYNYGRANFLLYDHPGTGRFVWLANDLDTILEWNFLPPDTTPVLAPVPIYNPRWERDWHHYLIALNDPAGVPRYIDALAAQLPKLDPDEIAQWVDDWSAQIADAAAEDPRRPFSMENHADALEEMKSYSPARVAYLQTWLDCRQLGGADGDGDGHDMCHDCNDADPAQSPSAAEVCDEVDNDCDGRVDEMLACPEPPPE